MIIKINLCPSSSSRVWEADEVYRRSSLRREECLLSQSVPGKREERKEKKDSDAAHHLISASRSHRCLSFHESEEKKEAKKLLPELLDQTLIPKDNEDSQSS